MQVSYRGGSPLYFWPNYSREPREGPATWNCDRPPLTEAPSVWFTLFHPAPILRFPLSLSFFLSFDLSVSSRSLLLSPFDGCEAFSSFFFCFSLCRYHSTFASFSLFFYRTYRRFTFSVRLVCPFFLFRSLPLFMCMRVCLFVSLSFFLFRPVVGSDRSGAADLLWNLYSYRAPQQWSQPPHFSTPDLCYRSGFLSSDHGNLFC